jgi:hypothetical protein
MNQNAKTKPKQVTPKRVLKLEPGEAAALARLLAEQQKAAQHGLMVKALAKAVTDSPHGQPIRDTFKAALAEKLKSRPAAQPTRARADNPEVWLDHAIAAVEDHLDYGCDGGDCGLDCEECDRIFSERLRAARAAARGN